MRKLGMNELRKEYLNFFGSKKNHTVLKSFSLIPEDDDSLLLINAGMAPLKKYFTGEKKMKNNRATSSQRCIRTGDIERVGITERHGTFFEMLGNFSFGDYFKREAIHWAYEFLTENLEIDKDLLWVSVYENDDEAYKIWNEEIGLSKDRILRFGKEDNFWELEVGPCGPDSEIFVDRGVEKAIDENDNKPGNDDSDRFMEVWNLVFTQFNKNINKEYTPLLHPNIDTGMGLERMAMVLQNKDNIFEIDVNQNIIREIEELSNKKYKENKKDDISIRVIADHAKAMTFMVSDGIQPSNEKRGYVLRRLIRRAFRHGKLLGIEGEFLSSVIDCVIDSYKDEYDELVDRKDKIVSVIKKEEANFQNTIDSGLDILNEYIKDLKENNKDTLNGEDAFKLYDTYGFPLDLTKEILTENNLKVDTKEFDKQMENQRNLARNARKSDAGWSLDSINIDEFDKTEFVGYDDLEVKANIIGLFDDKEKVSFIKEGNKGIVISDKTSFYAEGGGQVADTGLIITGSAKAKVYNVQKKNEIIIHYVEVIDGDLNLAKADFIVDKERRLDITRNHTATHLLDQALRNILNEDVKQAGSLVDEEKLRFDFTYPNALSDDEIEKIENEINEKIRQQLKVKKEIMPYKESEKLGAIGLFEDKYKDMVRVVSIDDYSIELCGGCHVNNSSEVLMFKILQESSAASGIRRIEAITGRKVYEYLNSNLGLINVVSKVLKTNPKNILSKAESLNEEIKNLKLDIQKLKEFNEKDVYKDIENEVQDAKGIKLLVHKFENEDLDTLRNFEERIKEKYKDLIVVFATVNNDKIVFTASVSDSLTNRYNAGKIVKEVSKITGGNGGGKKNFAQAGGKDISKLDEALKKVYELI
ncbi:alanine--tRNA ligase [Anaerococcus hydrogenalis]|uniref:Alanine--tRNA ligase n=1 Tax=Anaerococcus hydrogenalis TaxID=33029 RepID=A0A2N6ULA4_9FIRM|nr:alanine--tRNA ligase [Anaerococcus hydrogenalis]MDK7694536.1 alanine--tRNA ligase [Anaerococcus hydrogenalis]MDK7696314.1 alanine--tRNA ligase [Anaerococcus hydrogenalis]MDK7707563.1 alanine--tRNA ligase [Anaerococcus hydrogenalis]PMC82576.1 alanine--tRNA ligase [Anaerococcus hydrogenalis]